MKLPREKELNLIIDGLEKENNDLIADLRKAKKLVCQVSSHIDGISRRIDDNDKMIETYNKELYDLKWDKMVDGVTNKM